MPKAPSRQSSGGESSGDQKRKRDEESSITTVKKEDVKGKGRATGGLSNFFLPSHPSAKSSASTINHQFHPSSPSKNKTKHSPWTTETTPIVLSDDSDEEAEETILPRGPTSRSPSTASSNPVRPPCRPLSTASSSSSSSHSTLAHPLTDQRVSSLPLSASTRSPSHAFASTSSSSSSSSSALDPMIPKTHFVSSTDHPSNSTSSSLPSKSYWTCPECSKRFHLSASLPHSTSASSLEEEQRGRELVDERVRIEHLDLHLAMELQEESVGKGVAGRERVIKPLTKGKKLVGRTAAAGSSSGTGANAKKVMKRTNQGAGDGGGLGGWLLRKDS